MDDNESGSVWSLGLMSGTSMDGVDAALIRTDGEVVTAIGPSLTTPYEPAFRGRLRGALGRASDFGDLPAELAQIHAVAVAALLEQAGMTPKDVAWLGFHGQTTFHAPKQGRTCQIGDGRLLARLTAIDTVYDFRSQDVAAGGEGAPLAPLYHAALARTLSRPLAVLNVGGVSNVTWIGEDGRSGEAILAFDCGPGNAMIDDWVAREGGLSRDEDGELARAGGVDRAVLATLLENDYLARPAPKSLDRDHFNAAPLGGLSLADGAATLTAFTAACVERGVALMPSPPSRWLITGGGRHNPSIMAALAECLDAAVEPVEAVGWDGDALEAQAFAYLAVRVVRRLPTSLPGTTGVKAPQCGGVIQRAD